LLGLDGLGIEYIGDYPNGSKRVNERLELVHGDAVRKRPGGTVSVLLENAWISVGCGHGHRNEMATKRVGEGEEQRVITAFMCGCLCKVDGTVPGSTAKSAWQQGFGVVEYADSGEHTVNLYPIENGRAFFEGKVYEGEDYVGELRESTGFEF